MTQNGAQNASRLFLKIRKVENSQNGAERRRTGGGTARSWAATGPVNAARPSVQCPGAARVQPPPIYRPGAVCTAQTAPPPCHIATVNATRNPSNATQAPQRGFLACFTVYPIPYKGKTKRAVNRHAARYKRFVILDMYLPGLCV